MNTKKCKIMHITRKKSPLVGEYFIEGQPLESVSVHKDLGLFTASDLSWNQHIDKITARANRVLGLVKELVEISSTLILRKHCAVVL